MQLPVERSNLEQPAPEVGDGAAQRTSGGPIKYGSAEQAAPRERSRGTWFERYYPGRRFVDVLALDGYNWGVTKPQFGGWRSFSKTFRRPYRRLSRLGRQPIWIAEVGSATEGGDKAAWVRNMFRTARGMRRVRALVWMDTIDPVEGDWRIRSPASVAAAFRG